MPSDLMFAIVVMVVISLIAGVIAGSFKYRERGQFVTLAFTLAVFATVYFQFYGSGQLFWARLVPFSAAIIYTNFAAIFAALAAGWALRLPAMPRWRRGLLSSALAVGSLIAILWPMLSIALRPPPEGGDRWRNGVALQTSWATCSPAAAATLLTASGIPASEAELVPLCLTDASGTPTLGLYRGLVLASQAEGKVPRLVDQSLEQMLAANRWPVLLAVELPYGVEDRRYVDQWGWIPGMGHSVVALGRTRDGGILIGDPAVGLERWSAADLKLLWHGNGIRMEDVNTRP
jgi:hypothetical protein